MKNHQFYMICGLLSFIAGFPAGGWFFVAWTACELWEIWRSKK